jgi:hypothetical protein
LSTDLATPADAVDLEGVDLFDLRWHRNGPPHQLLARMRAEAPVRWNPLPDGTGCCLGRLDLRIIFEEVTRRLADLQLAGEVERIPSSWTNALRTLPATFTPGARESVTG